MYGSEKVKFTLVLLLVFACRDCPLTKGSTYSSPYDDYNCVLNTE